MKTEPQTETEAIAAWFTEEEVKQWLIARTSLYQLPGLTLRITGADLLPYSGNVGPIFECGTSLDSVVDQLRGSLPNPVSLREQAKQLLKQANELESEQERAETDELRTEGKKHVAKPNIHA